MKPITYIPNSIKNAVVVCLLPNIGWSIVQRKRICCLSVYLNNYCISGRGVAISHRGIERISPHDSLLEYWSPIVRSCIRGCQCVSRKNITLFLCPPFAGAPVDNLNMNMNMGKFFLFFINRYGKVFIQGFHLDCNPMSKSNWDRVEEKVLLIRTWQSLADQIDRPTAQFVHKNWHWELNLKSI